MAPRPQPFLDELFGQGRGRDVSGPGLGLELVEHLGPTEPYRDWIHHDYSVVSIRRKPPPTSGFSA
jgi:hypothetical protein